MTAPAIPDLPQSCRVGVVVERRAPTHPWGEDTWQAVEVLIGAPEGEGWRALEHGDGVERHFAGSLEIELFRRETADYKVNLGQTPPLVYVVLRNSVEDAVHPVTPFLATVSPYEAESYAGGEETRVSAVPMPAPVAAWLAAFVERHHVDEPFVKRKQKPKVDRAEGGLRRKPRV